MAIDLTFSQPELFSQIFEYSPIGMSFLSKEGKWLRVNSSLCRMLGYSESEFLDMTFQDITHPDDLARSLHIKNQILEGNMENCELEKRFIHKNGFTVWVLVVINCMRDVGKQPLFFISQIKDITESKLAEEDLKAKTEQLESFIENNADAIWMIDAEDTLLEVNPAFEKLFGWSSEEVKGSKLPIIPEFLIDSINNIHQGIRAGETVVGLETTRMRKDGTLIHVEATLSPLRDQRGAIIGITGICRDVTAKKLAEEDLKAKTQQLESFIENNADSILIFNNEGFVLRVNEAFEHTFGWSKEEVIGTELHLLPFIPAACAEEFKHSRERVKKGLSVIGVETMRLHKNGDLLNVVLTASPILDGKGSQIGWSVTFRDITEWKIAQDHLQNSEKLSVAGQLAAGIAHEIRNPITSIKGFIHLMQSGFGEKKKYFDIMTSEIERIEMILSELLILAKPQLIKYERKDIRVLLSQVMTLIDSQAILNNVEFIAEFKPGVTHLYCDENQLKQVFINFIKNAIESMPNGGKITIEIHSDHDQEMKIRLIDQGCGIPNDVLSKLGQPFYTTKEKGTGLGFMVSKKIIENHSGHIKVESEVDKGTTIEITLPFSN
ncbi:PAS domain S-box protein [Paenibacillus qinlingensis]|uniref:histidine kinase n=1 Tax=Paenibacillus qinlingensis TaxID=1837343 RepID=A0ABU1P283_9BACL|nr:PAS domain S-box protein [Paenibacillus qinlingensis]MDR6553177.1 PAS domain S-box-containing protein [Paenibacillus qinlingensis]